MAATAARPARSGPFAATPPPTTRPVPGCARSAASTRSSSAVMIAVSAAAAIAAAAAGGTGCSRSVACSAAARPGAPEGAPAAASAIRAAAVFTPLNDTSYSPSTRATGSRSPPARGVAVAASAESAAPPGLAVSAGSDVQKQALNGAQVAELRTVIDAVAQGLIPAATAKAIILAAYPLDVASVDAMLSPLDGFVPRAAAPASLPPELAPTLDGMPA